jgi:glutathione S-transferase
MSAEYAPIHLVMLLALLEYFGFALAVGRARYRYGVKAPATSGNIDFERYYRAQMNTLEQLVIFVPALWSFAIFISVPGAVGAGVAFIVGRLLYFVGYTKAAEKRSAGFGIATLAQLILLVGGIVGAVLAL